MRILVKLPTRERPKRLMEAYQAAQGKAHDRSRLQWMFAVDRDDHTAPLDLLNQYGIVIQGERKTKIEACNRGVANYGGQWDVVVLLSDDMLCRVDGWDEIIREDMAQHFPDTDGCLWYPDGHQKDLCTLAVMGRKAFDAIGYIYRPEYSSLWCDKEWTEYWSEHGKMYRSATVLFSHLHPAWGTAKMDKLYRKNNGFNTSDRDTYNRRRALNFQA